jgi:hypothetical protein
VGLRQDGWTDLGECRWGRIRSARQVREELEAKVGLFPNRRNATIGRRIFTREAVGDERSRAAEAEVRWHTLERLPGKSSRTIVNPSHDRRLTVSSNASHAFATTRIH